MCIQLYTLNPHLWHCSTFITVDLAISRYFPDTVKSMAIFNAFKCWYYKRSNENYLFYLIFLISQILYSFASQCHRDKCFWYSYLLCMLFCFIILSVTIWLKDNKIFIYLSYSFVSCQLLKKEKVVFVVRATWFWKEISSWTEISKDFPV